MTHPIYIIQIEAMSFSRIYFPHISQHLSKLYWKKMRENWNPAPPLRQNNERRGKPLRYDHTSGVSDKLTSSLPSFYLLLPFLSLQSPLPSTLPSFLLSRLPTHVTRLSPLLLLFVLSSFILSSPPLSLSSTSPPLCRTHLSPFSPPSIRPIPLSPLFSLHLPCLFRSLPIPSVSQTPTYPTSFSSI